MARTHRSIRLLIILAFFASTIGIGVIRSTVEESVAAPVLQTRDVPVISTTTVPSTTTTAAVAKARTSSGGGAIRTAPKLEPIVRIGEIEIPKIGLSHAIYHGITMRNIDNGPSHWPGTAMPGEVGNAVFAGHRVTHSHPFRNIDQLVPGDQVIFTINGVRSVYSVTGHEIVTPDALWIADQTPTPTASIFGCHPPGSARYRYVVRMSLVQ